MTTGLFVVANVHETAPGLIAVDNVRYTDFIYDPAVLLATQTVVLKDDISGTVETLDRWQVQWSVVVADLATFNAMSRNTVNSAAIVAINVAYPGSI